MEGGRQVAKTALLAAGRPPHAATAPQPATRRSSDSGREVDAGTRCPGRPVRSRAKTSHASIREHGGSSLFSLVVAHRVTTRFTRPAGPGCHMVRWRARHLAVAYLSPASTALRTPGPCPRHPDNSGTLVGGSDSCGRHQRCPGTASRSCTARAGPPPSHASCTKPLRRTARRGCASTCAARSRSSPPHSSSPPSSVSSTPFSPSSSPTSSPTVSRARRPGQR